jgi:quercetin dioxygenase-like cupin family protein
MTAVQELDLQLTDGEDRQCVWETEEIRVMRVRLAGKGALPRHDSDANVLMLPVTGALNVVTPDGEHALVPGQALALPRGTDMQVSNPADEGNVFLVIKTPRP